MTRQRERKNGHMRLPCPLGGGNTRETRLKPEESVFMTVGIISNQQEQPMLPKCTIPKQGCGYHANYNLKFIATWINRNNYKVRTAV